MADANFLKKSKILLLSANKYTETINELPEDSVLKSEAVLNAIKGISEIGFKQYINIEKLISYMKKDTYFVQE